MKIRVGVIFGGETVEHEVSIITAVQAIEYIDKEKYDVIPIYIAKDRTWYTGSMLMDMDIYQDFDHLKRYAKKVSLYNKEGRFFLQNTKGVFRKDIAEIDLVFPIVHGNNAEDGSLAGYLETLGVPYVGSKVLGSALGQDKVIMKQIFQAEDIPYIEYVWFYDHEYLFDAKPIHKKVDQLGYPVVVKPASLGSSIGIRVVKKATDLATAIEEAIKYDDKIIIEKMVENLLEVNCAVVGNTQYQETSLIAEMLTSNDILTYQDKYLGDAAKKGSGLNGGKAGGMANSAFIIPARLDKELEQQVLDLSRQAFRVLNLGGVARIDFLIDQKSKKVYVNEPNTIPGCLSFYMFTPAGKSYTTLLDDLITIAIKDYKEKTRKVYSFDSNLLFNFGGLKGMKGLKNKIQKP